MWNRPVAPRILDAAQRLKARGLVRYLAVSTHTRALVPATAAGRDFDIVHFATTPRIPAPKPTFSRICPMPAGRAWWHSRYKLGQLLGKATLQGIARFAFAAQRRAHPHAADCYRYVLTRPEVMCA